MKRAVLLFAALGIVSPAIASTALAQTDQAGCKDHPLFPTRMPGYSIAACKVEEFGVYEFFTKKPPKIPVEGRFTFITYVVNDRKAEPSGIAVVRNYENAIRSIGGTILGSVPNWWVNAKIQKDGREVWAQAEKGNGKIWLRIVEKKGMEQFVVADAAALGNGLKASGHVAVYGINFDTNKSEVKPDSKPALDEIARLLKQDPTLKLKVVGHTDMTGLFDANMRLSQARAEAVVQALVAQYGVATARLKGFGVGPLAPVASNDVEEGRAKNRRVELVKE